VGFGCMSVRVSMASWMGGVALECIGMHTMLFSAILCYPVGMVGGKPVLVLVLASAGWWRSGEASRLLSGPFVVLLPGV